MPHDGQAEPPRELDRRSEIDTREGDHKLVAAIADGGLAGSGGISQELAELAQDGIAGHVTQRVVDLLELVDVEDDERDGTLLHLPLREEAFEQPTVADAGESILLRRSGGLRGSNLEIALVPIEVRAGPCLLHQLSRLPLVDRPHVGLHVASVLEGLGERTGRLLARSQLLESQHQLVVVAARLGDAHRAGGGSHRLRRPPGQTKATGFNQREGGALVRDGRPAGRAAMRFDDPQRLVHAAELAQHLGEHAVADGARVQLRAALADQPAHERLGPREPLGACIHMGSPRLAKGEQERVSDVLQLPVNQEAVTAALGCGQRHLELVHRPFVVQEGIAEDAELVGDLAAKPVVGDPVQGQDAPRRELGRQRELAQTGGVGGRQAGRIDGHLRFARRLEEAHGGASVLTDLGGAPLVGPHARSAHEEARPAGGGRDRGELALDLSLAGRAVLGRRRPSGTLEERLEVDCHARILAHLRWARPGLRAGPPPPRPGRAAGRRSPASGGAPRGSSPPTSRTAPGSPPRRRGRSRRR